MYQMDMFNSNKEDFLYGEIQKMQNSNDKVRRAIFALITELQEEVMGLKEQVKKKG